MTQTKTLVMKDTMCHEFSKVFTLCSYVLVSVKWLSVGVNKDPDRTLMENGRRGGGWG